MSGACAELRCFCLVSVSRPGLAFRVCCECPDCVFAAARIASLVQLNFVGVETDARHNPRNSCRSRLYIEFVPQPFRLKAQTHRLSWLRVLQTCCTICRAKISRCIVWHWQSREGCGGIARRSLVEQLPRKARPSRSAHAFAYLASSPRPTRSSGACSARRENSPTRKQLPP